MKVKLSKLVGDAALAKPGEKRDNYTDRLSHQTEAPILEALEEFKQMRLVKP